MEISYLVFFLSGLAIAIAFVALHGRAKSGGISLVIFGLALAAWSIFGAIILSGTHPNLFLLWGLRMLSVNIVAIAFCIFALTYSSQGVWRLTRTRLVLLIGIPFVCQILYWTNISSEIPFLTSGAVLEKVLPSAGIWYLVSVLYSNVLMAYAAFVLFRAVLGSAIPGNLRYGTLLVSLIAPLAIVYLSLAGLSALPVIDLVLIALTIVGMVIVLALFSLHLLDFVPIARTMAIENMNDGWMVLDKQNRIIDLNPAAMSIIDLSREDILGQRAEDILSNWENLFQEGNVKEQEFRGSVRMKEGWKYFSVRITPLVGVDENGIGKIVLWRDITERRKADEARQRARDEMFVLLHSISGAASRALDLKDFLAEVIRQIVYSFHSQASTIFLLDELNEQTDSPRLVLAAQYGLSDRDAITMSSLSISDGLVESIYQKLEPILFSNVEADPRIPEVMQKQGYASMLIIPMAIDGHLVGIIGLARKEEPSFSADEITRMNIVADEIAAYVYTNRQRQLAIAVEERQRLVRDLHDSVTQKLYGLVALTEAAQAGLEANSEFQPKQVLSRIGVYARQALKEMRLFLYELQPIDLEHEGLVAALHQRLAAVEGRSDIKAGLIADETISLSLEKQIALYFITQEALNNILRHADAKSVTVRLRQRKINVNLDIDDDGCGFDLKKVDNGGIGLKNMRERVQQIGGKIKIVSSPGNGTKIKVTVRKDRL
jgi:PAS domain S-box-containing protein